MNYRLRRLNFANLQHDTALLKLSFPVTRIGRHSESNLCLISEEHPCLTSRLHSEIHCLSDDEVDTKYLLRDTSLNGTYVNDRRVIDYHLLTEGDVVTFGHYGGHLIKKGELAPNKRAEFQFVFEKATSVVSSPEELNQYLTVQPPSQSSTNNTDDDGELSQVISTSIHRVTQFTQSDSEGSGHVECDHTTDRTNCFCKNNEEVIWPSGENPNLIATADGFSGEAACDKMRENFPFRNGCDFSMSAILSNPSCRLQTIRKSYPQADGSSCNMPVVMQSSSGQYEYVSDTSHSNSFQPVVNTSQATVSSLSGKETMQTTGRSPLFDISRSFAPQSNSLTRRHSVPKLRKESAAVPDTSTSSAGKKRRATSNKSQRKRPTNSTSGDRLQYHSTNDKCAAIDCMKPKSNKVLWVQCDDCDAWYHTACAGCTSSANQLALAQFHCGCV